MSKVELTQKNFDEIVSKHDLVIIDFWAKWCAPCRSFKKVIESVSQDYPEIVFGGVDIEKEKELAGEFNVMSVPAIMILRNRVLVFAESGALTAQALRELIAQAKTLDAKALEKAKKQKAR